MITFDWMEYKHENTEEARMHNLAILREGVAGLKCTHAGQFSEEELTLYQFFMETAYPNMTGYFSIVERYENGNKNFFVRYDNYVLGVVRIRVTS